MRISRVHFAALTVLCVFLWFGANAETAEAVTVTSAMPSGQVTDLTQITVRFSETMRPLGVMDEQQKTAPLKLAVSEGKLPPGTFRWLDPSTLAYIFDKPVDRPIRIRATVPKGTQPLTAPALAAEVAWDIATPPLEFTLGGHPDMLPRKNASFSLVANYPLNAKTLREKSRLTANGKALKFKLAAEPEMPESQGRQNAWRYTYTLAENLPPNSDVLLTIPKGLTARTGGVPADEASFPLRGYGPLVLENWNLGAFDPANPGTDRIRPEERLFLRFSNPLTYSDLIRHITVTPTPAGTPEADEFSRSHSSAGFSLPYRWEPRTAYTVTVKPGLKDNYGQTLDKEISIAFTTGDYRPLLEMRQGAAVLESALSGLLPLTMRNMGVVTASVRYLPWGKDAFSLAAERAFPASGEFRSLNGARETAARIETTDKPNQTLREILNLPKILGLHPGPARGRITAELVPPKGQDAGNTGEAAWAVYKNGLFRLEAQITDLGIAARMGGRQGFAWVVSINSGTPVPDADVSLLDTTGKTLWRGKTDGSGIALLPGLDALPAMPRFCAAATRTDESVLDLAFANLPKDKAEYDKQKARSVAWGIHAVTQLSLYQPGQTVNATLYARRHTDEGGTRDFANWLPMAGEHLRVTVADRNGKDVHSFEARTNAYGSAPFSFTLPQNAEPGWYSVRAKAESVEYEAGVSPFRVESFRPPEFKVDVTPPPSQPVPTGKNTRLPVKIAAGYFSGALLPGGTVQLTVDETETRFAPPRLSGYVTGPFAFPYGVRWYGQQNRRTSATVSGKLDATGAASLTLPPLEKSLSPRNLFLTATVTDAAGLASQGAGGCLIHPSEYYIGIRAPYIARQNQETAILYKAATWDDKPLSGKTFTLKAERIIWENGKERRETAWKKPLTLKDETGDRVTVSFDRSGQYRVTASIVDGKGRESVAVATVYVPGKDLVWGVSRYNSGMLDLLAEEKTLAPGETARLVIKNPFDAAYALVAIEREGVRRTLVREVSGDNPVLEIPVEEADAPYVYASVLLVKGRTAPPPLTALALADSGKNPAASDNRPKDNDGSPVDSVAIVMPDDEYGGVIPDEGAPTLWQGSVPLLVSGREDALAVAVTTDKEEYRPGGEVKAVARVTKNSNPQKAQVTFLAVDERILRAGGEFTTYDPRASFGPQYPNTVNAANLWRLLLKYHETANSMPLPRMAKAMDSAMAAPMAAGGEMAAFAQADGDASVTARRDFSPLAFWLAEGETDETGVLAVAFTLPDSLTSYRVVAIAADAETGFAGAELSIRAAKPLQLLPALPKFATEGDVFEAGILVQNTGTEPGEAVITLHVTGAAIGTASGTASGASGGNSGGTAKTGGKASAASPGSRTDSRTIRLQAGRSGLVTFPLTVDALTGLDGKLRLRAEGRMGNETDAAQFTLPVKPARPLTHVAAAGLLAEGETYTLPVKAPARLDPRSRMEVTFAPSPAAGAPLAAKQVIGYPWNCLEQRLSRAWARILRLEHGDLLGLAPDAADRDEIMKEFDAVPAHQKSDGSFTLWPGMGSGGPDDEGGVNLFITAYALLVSRDGLDVTISLPGTVTDKALDYVEKILSGLVKPDAAESGKKQKKGADAFRPAPETCALALYALALHRPESAAPLFPGILALCAGSETTPMGWGALLLAMNEVGTGTAGTMPDRDETTARILAALEKTAAVTPTHLHFGSAYGNIYWRSLGSTLRDNALVLSALAAVKQNYPRLEALAAWVGQSLGDRPVLTTQEAAFGLRGLARYLQTLGGNRETAVLAVWNGKDEASAMFTKLMDPPSTWVLPFHSLNGGNASALNLSATSGRPYWTARLAYASPDVPVKTENAGFTVTRTLSSKGPWKVGDIVEVTVTVTVPATRRHVLLFDPFPAGFEPLFTSRIDLMDRAKQEDGGVNDGPWRFEDAMDDGMLLYAPVAHPGTYSYTHKLRAMAAGTFIQRPTAVEEMYTPEVFGRTDAGTAVIRPK